MLLASLMCFGQNPEDESDTLRPRLKISHIIKGDLTKPIMAAANGYAAMGFGVEFFWGKRSSIQISGYGTHNRTVTQQASSETREEKNVRTFLIDYRIYLIEETAPTGIYLGPYLSHTRDRNERRVLTQNTQVSLDGLHQTYGGAGAVFGYQAKITSWFFIDFNSRVGLNTFFSVGPSIFGERKNEIYFEGYFDLSIMLAFRL